MDFDYQICKLTNAFTKDYPSSTYPEVLYGYKRNEKNIAPNIGRISYISKESAERARKRFENLSDLPEVQSATNADYFSGWEPK